MVQGTLESEDEWVLGRGWYGTVTKYDETTVIKGYISYRDGRQELMIQDYETDEELQKNNAREREVYARLSTNPDLKVLKYYGAVELEPGHFGIRLEWAKNRDLRAFIEKNKSEDHPFERRLAWVIDLAETLQGIHDMGVIHSDFSCRNVMVTEDLSLRIGDFNGSKLDDKAALTWEEPRYELPSRGRRTGSEEIPPMKRELFALGCAIYEVMAWQKPRADLEEQEVEKAYEREELPDITDVPCASVIRKCWNEEFETAEDVAVALRACRGE